MRNLTVTIKGIRNEAKAESVSTIFASLAKECWETGAEIISLNLTPKGE